MSLVEEFFEFLKEYSVIGLAVAFVIGVSAKDLVNAVVDDVVMPVIELFLLGGEWQKFTYRFFGAELKLGHLAAALLDFLIIAALVFLVAKYVMKKEEVGKL
ncbi:MAG: MscL family protein [Candidatus Nanohaloarchaea archaeon]